MATEPVREISADEAREAAIRELQKAITALHCGGIQEAWNHAAAAQAWLHEIPL